MPKTASQAALDMFAEHADIFSEAFDVSVCSIDINDITTYLFSLKSAASKQLSEWIQLSHSTQSITREPVLDEVKFLLLRSLVSF